VHAPALQDGVEIELGRTGADVGTAARARNGVVRPDDLPQDDRASDHRARLAQDFTFIAAKLYRTQLSSIGIPVMIGCQVGGAW
jgi:hypothetical protein